MADNGTLDFEARVKMDTEGAVSSIDDMVKKAEEAGLNIDRYFTLSKCKKSITEIKNEIEKWREKQKALGDEYGKTENAIAKAEKSISQMKAGLSQAEISGDDMGVRVFTSKIAEEEKNLQSLKNKLGELGGEIDATLKPVSELNEKFTALKNIEKLLENAQPALGTKIRKNKAELAQMAAAGQQNTEAYKKLEAETIQLSRQQTVLNKTLSAGVKSGLSMAATMQGLQALSGAYSVGLGVASLFSSNQKDQLEIQTKLQSAMSITVGIQGVYQSLLKSSAMMQGLYAAQTKAATIATKLKTAAEGKGAIATKAATIAQKAFNIVAKANPYVLLAMALVTVVGALAAFAVGTSKAKKEQESFNLSLEKKEKALARLNTEQENNIKIMQAEGASEEEILHQRLENARAVERETAAVIDLIKARADKNGKLSEDDKNALAEWLKKNEDAYNAINSILADSTAYQIRLEREKQAEIKRLTEQANKEQLDLQKSRTKDKMKLIDLELQQTIAAIKKERAAYQEKYGKGADTSQFSRRIDIAKQGAADKRSAVSRERGRQYEDLAADTDKFQQNQEIEVLKQQADATTDLNEKLLLQAEIRQRLLNIELDQLDIDRQRALEDAGDDEQQKQIINQTYDNKVEQVQSSSAMKGAQDEQAVLEQRKAQYEAFAQRTVEIEQQRIENIKKIDAALAAGDISEATAAEQRQFVETQASQDTEQASIETLGTNVEGLGEELNAIMQSVLNQGLMTVQAQLPMLKAELASLKANKNADPKQLAVAMTKVAAAEKVVNDYTEGLGTSQKEYGKSAKENCGKAAAALKVVGEAVDMIADNFGEFMGEAGQDAMQVIQTVVTATQTALTAISTTSITAAEGVKTAEKASVILAIISAAIQVVMALVNVFAKYFSKAAQTQALIDKNNEAIETSKNRVKELQAAQKSQTGRDYWKNQWEQIDEYNKQAKLAAENEKLAKQKKEESNTSKKKDDAEQQAQEAHQAQLDAEEAAREAMEEFYEEMSGTSLKSFSENLADSIVEGFKSGTEDMRDIWDGALDDMFTDMIKQQINLSLQKRLAGVFQKVQDAFAGGDTHLTQTEMEAMKAEFENAKAGAEAEMEQWRQLMETMGLTTDDDIEASSGGFESMSQDTADELNGRFTALQMSGASIDAKMQLQLDGTNMLITQAQGIKDTVALMVGIATNQLEELRDINAHTALLEETNKRLKQIQLNTDKL